MAPLSIKIPVDPAVLTWARTSMGLDIEEVSLRMKVSKKTLENWESGDEQPTLSKLERLADVIYKRPIALFFMPNPPKDPIIPHDYRTASKGKIKELSPKSRLALRRARRVQSLTYELTEDQSIRRFLPKGESIVHENPEVIAARERRSSQVDINTQFKLRDEYKALSYWQSLIEKKRIIVIQESFPVEEARAFSITDGGIPVIILNTHDHPNARVFSIFHEYAHIMINKGGICDMRSPHRARNIHDSIEIFCNYFAGAFLVPRNDLVHHPLVANNGYLPKWPDATIGSIANDFCVSREVILRRMVICDLTSNEFYKKKRQEYLKKKKKKQVKVIVPKPLKCLSENGVTFTNLVLESFRNGRIGESELSDYLNVKLKHIPDIEHLLESKKDRLRNV